MSQLLTTKQQHDLRVLELTCYTGREDYLESCDVYETDAEEKHRGLYIGVFYTTVEHEPDVHPGYTFFIDYPNRIFSSNVIFTSEEQALKAGREAVDKLLEIVF